MTPNKTPQDIIKALQTCGAVNMPCGFCSYDGHAAPGCIRMLCNDAAELLLQYIEIAGDLAGSLEEVSRGNGI